jgi:hypothetical protein
MVRRSESWIVALLLILLLAGNAWPQAGIGTVSGTVRDQTGAVIPGANVLLRNTATNIASKTTTTGAGLYMFAGVVAGRYDLQVEFPGM